ncbi:MAG: phosphoribosylanthranilate isomerase [Holophagales bacterium]|nr:phosphoribosylanthranilate isomerase [Holophagales bacterium]
MTPPESIPAPAAAVPEALGPAGGRPKVKICGVKTVAEARLALELGADLLGLNFHPPSPRYIDPGAAGSLVAEVEALKVGKTPRPAARWVGVFVDRPVAEVMALGERVGLDLLQFHGGESPGELEAVAPRAIKAFRVAQALDAGMLEHWLGLGLWGLLVDSRHPTLAGGSGRSWDVASLRRLPGSLRARLEACRLMVAGGIRPDNVRAVLDAAQPWGIDLCSGVESRPGTKDPALMRRLFEEIRDGETPPAA